MNWVTLGKICTVLIAVLQAILGLCNGEGFSLTSISTIIAALIAAGFIHGGQVQVKKVELKRLAVQHNQGGSVTVRSLILIACLLPVLALTSCAESAIIAGGIAGAGGISGIVLWLTKQPWMVKICYWVGNEGALTAMPHASATVDADTIAVCAEGVAYLQTAKGVPASEVNATLAATISKLPTAQVATIQEAAAILDEFLPPSTSTLVLTSEQLDDIIGFLKGWQDGTTTCLNNLPPEVQKALLKAKSKRADLRAKHLSGLKAVQPGGWFCTPAPAAK